MPTNIYIYKYINNILKIFFENKRLIKNCYNNGIKIQY